MLFRSCLAVETGPNPPSPRPGSDQALAGRRMLLAEDNPVNQEVARSMFEMLGAKLDVVPDGRRAVAAALERSYDMIFMDCQMPEMDGFTAVGLIREHERRANSDAGSSTGSRGRRVIVALTAHARKEDRERCLAAGMDDYVSKPFDRDQLRTVAERWLPAAGSQVDAPAESAAAGGRVGAPRDAEVARGASERQDEGGEPAVNLTALDQIRSLQRPGAPSVLERVAKLYFTNTPDLLASMATAIARADREALRQAAHTLKSTSATLGAGRLARLCRETEEVARTGAPISETSRVDSMQAEYERVRRDLLAVLEASS